MRRKFLVFLIALCAVLPMAATRLLDMDLFAAGTILNTPSGGVADSLHIGDEIYLGTAPDDSYIFLGKDNDYVYFLKENVVGSATDYKSALNRAIAYKNDANFGKVGNAHLSLSGNEVNLISKVELQGISGLITNDQLVSSVAIDGGKWWLKDADMSGNRANFVDDHNMAGTNAIQSAVLNNGTCSVSSSTEIGVLPIRPETKVPQVFLRKEVASAKLKIFHDGGTLKRTTHHNSTCNNSAGGTAQFSSATYEYDYSKDANGKESWTRSQYGALVVSLIAHDGWRPRVKLDENGNLVMENTAISKSRSLNGCYKMDYDDATIHTDGGASGSYYKVTNGSGTVSASLQSYSDVTYRDVYCPEPTNPAGSAFVRPYVKIKASDVIMRNNAKRTYAQSTVLSAANILRSDNAGHYLTLQTSALSIDLNRGVVGVSGNVYEVEKARTNTIISLPVYFSASNLSEGTRYVSAEATDVNGNVVYGVLSQLGSGNTASVNIDYANLLKPNDNAFKITLYLEDSGAGDTSYRSQGTEIIVKIKEPQYIRFSSGNAGILTYGSELTMRAELYDFDTMANGDIKQANTDLTFSISAADANKAYISAQSYDLSTGIAQATIVPLTGSGTFDLIITKNGDSTYYYAQKQTVTIQLAKKNITLVPSDPPGITAVIGDIMPSLEPDVKILNPKDGLVKGDAIPVELYPILEPVDVALASHPADGGVVSNPGSWKMLFPDPSTITSTSVTQFTEKYNITFEDYDDDNDYVFTVDPDGILERWIEITPVLTPPQTWHRTPVTLKPSSEAKYFGYLEIALVTNGVDGPFDSSVILSDDTPGVRPIVKLKNINGDISSAKQLNTKIKIDQTNPELSIDIPSGWANAKKTIQLLATDATSGIDTIDPNSVRVSYVNANGTKDAITLNNNGSGSYSFDATQNGLYEFIVRDRAGNEITMLKTIKEIDVTPASLTATLGNLSPDGDYHEITVTRVEPDSGINYIQVYFQGDGDTALSLIGHLNRTQATQTYQATANGKYVFRMETGAKELLEAEVLVSDVTKIRPIVGINAINMGDYSVYLDHTWINQDVKVILSNINMNFTDPIIFQYRKVSDVDWIDISGNSLSVSTTTWMSDMYEFRAVSTDAESLPATITINIDKEKPQPPVMNHPEQLDDDYTFIEQAEISGSLLAKDSGIAQLWEYSLDGGNTWTEAVNNQFIITQAGDYEMQVRTKDEAGNYSDIDTYPVHVKGKLSQTIAFDQVPASLTYGTCDTFSAKLTSDISEQANTPLLFAPGAGSQDKIDITSQSYDPSTGIATATICPKNGDVFFDLEISKAGDTHISDALTQTATIALHKKQLIVHPQVILGKIVGDVMPTLLSEGNALVNGDTIPNALTVDLTPIGTTADPLPTDAGNPLIAHAGTWSMTYPANILSSNDLGDFVKKYDVILEDYNTNTKYVFTAATDGIPDEWIIVTPNPNGAGWNKDNVKIELSADATAAGWQSVALIENGVETLFGASIELSDETNGITPIVVLKKADGTTSQYKVLRQVKIDKTKPSVASITIDHENDWTNTDKEVTLAVSDAAVSNVSSGIQDVIVTDPSGNTVALNQVNTDTYIFSGDNGVYHVKVVDQADNVYETDITIAKVDKTAPTISAVLGAINSDGTAQAIDVQATVGASNVDSFSLYFKKKASDPYPTAPSEALNPNNLTLNYMANQNGWYCFEIVNGAGDKAIAEVEVSGLNVVTPLVSIQAELDDGMHTPYPGAAWVNQDVIITLSNTETSINEPITYEYKKATDTTWKAISGNQVKIEESAWQDETYEFRGVISDGNGAASSFNVKIDKEKPQEPIIADANKFDQDHFYAAPLTINGSTVPKNSGINQKIMVSEDHGITWSEMSGNTLTLNKPDTYSLSFKTVDEAGNESDEYTLEDVNVNDGTPRIDIKLNHNLLKDIAHHFTFGYLFKDRVDVDIEVQWYGMAAGQIYYILDDSATPSVPDKDDPRWVLGDATSINPDLRTMVYAKAVNSDGKVAIASSTYYVNADQTPPTITFDKTYGNWMSDHTLNAQISDNMTGVDGASIKVKADISSGSIQPIISDDSLQLKNLPDGEYKVQVRAADNSGNEASETITVKIDTTAPEVDGVKDQSIYHQYYLPRFITVKDPHSGIAEATLTKDDGSVETINPDIKVTDIGEYTLYVKDYAGNEETIHFKIVPLPDIHTEIDCDETSREIIEQIEAEYDENQSMMDATERDNIQKWIEDARDIWNTCRIKIVYNEDRSAWVEGLGDVDFAPNAILVIEEIAESTLPQLPKKAKASYNVYLKLGDEIIEPSGKVQVHFPYRVEDEATYLYEIDEKDVITEIRYTQDGDYMVFETNSLEKYAITSDKPNTDDDPTTDDDSPNVDIDWDCDGEPDINIDSDGDGKPDINIDSDGDGKPDYNVDTDGDGKADMNIGPIKWDPNKCLTTSCGKPYCTSTYYDPYLNIDTDHDGRPDVNLDLDHDKVADINIDIDGDLIPDIEIDSDGDGKADINLDTTGDGRADTNLAIITVWKPDHNVDSPIKYDTMSGIKVDKTLTPDTWQSSKEYWDSHKQLVNGENQSTSANTGDETKTVFLWLLSLLSLLGMILLHQWEKHVKKKHAHR